jgi:hypothetical protein
MESTAPPGRYVYFPLTGGSEENVFSVRLLHLLPSHNPESQLRCHLVETTVPTGEGTHLPGVEYHALSYAWGDPVFPKTLEVVIEGEDGQPPESHAGLIHITENLHSALQNLRKQDETLVLWVDAVCINQADVRERNSQVTNMPRIYSQAASVIVWLGRDPEVRGYEALALRFLQDLASLVAQYELVSLEKSEWAGCGGNDSKSTRL